MMFRLRERSRLTGALAGVLLLPAVLTASSGQQATAAPGDGDAYLFAYFTGEGTADGETVSFAVSDGPDPLNWTTLNGGDPVLTSNLGTGGLRDPFLIRKQDDSGFVILATDLQMYGGGSFADAQETGSRSIMIWESPDLVNWSAQREVVLAPPNAGNLWAPEAHWDESAQEYLVYWASALYPSSLPPASRSINDSYQRMMYATTTDFQTFSTPQVWIDEQRGTGLGMIDSTIAEENGVYYRLTKDESYMGMRQESSTDLRRTQGVTSGDGWNLIAEQVGFGEPNPWGGTFSGGEGPTVFPSLTDNDWFLMQDQPSYHGGQGYMLFETSNLASANWNANLNANLPASPRHGTVIPINSAERAALLNAYGSGSGGGTGDGWHWVESAHSGLAWDIEGQTTDGGALLNQWDYWGGQNQQFRFNDVGGGYYTIEARHSGLMLDVYDWSQSNGADIIQWESTGGNNQQWEIRENSDGTVTFINRHSGKALDLYDWATDPGARISQYTDNGYAVQKWILHEVG